MSVTVTQNNPITVTVVQADRPDIAFIVGGKTEVSVSLVGVQGPQGLGATQTILAFAGGSLGGQRAVSINTVGEAVYFSLSFPDVIGITKNAVNIGDLVNIQIQDIMEDQSWNWTPGKVIYALTDGVMSQTPPVLGFIAIVGIAITSKKIRIEIEPSIEIV